MALADYFTPTWLKQRFLFGLPLVSAAGTAFPDEFYELQIAAGIEKVGEILNLQMEAVDLTDEPYSTSMNMSAWPNFSPAQLQRRPVREITRVRCQFGQNQLFDIPESWWNRNIPAGQAYDYTGQVMFVPTNSQITNISMWMGWPWAFQDVQPMFFRLSYAAGYEAGADVPSALQNLIGQAAALAALELAGAYIGGLGVQSKSVALDGLSTNRGNTKNATIGSLGGLSTLYKEQFDKGIEAARRAYTPPQMFAL